MKENENETHESLKQNWSDYLEDAIKKAGEGFERWRDAWEGFFIERVSERLKQNWIGGEGLNR